MFQELHFYKTRFVEGECRLGCGATWLESPINISSTLVGVSSPSASHLQKPFNSADHNYLEKYFVQYAADIAAEILFTN